VHIFLLLQVISSCAY